MGAGVGTGAGAGVEAVSDSQADSGEFAYVLPTCQLVGMAPRVVSVVTTDAPPPDWTSRNRTVPLPVGASTAIQ